MDWFLRIWLPIAIAITGICLLLYTVEKREYQYTQSENVEIVSGVEERVATSTIAHELQDRIWELQVIISIAWLSMLAVTLLATWLGARYAMGKTGVVW